MSSLRAARPRKFLLASGVLSSFAAFDISAVSAQQARSREQLPPIEISPRAD